MTDYTNLITGEHADKPNFVATVKALCQPFNDNIFQLAGMPAGFDLDTAVASQLDAVGEWIGISRVLLTPLTGVYFAFDTQGVGFDQGTWLGPFDNQNGLTSLPDDAYRNLLRAKIADNQWDGTVPTAYNILNEVFQGGKAVIQDNGDMTMLLGIIATSSLSAVTTALLEGGYLDIKPAGVRITAYVTPSILGSPFFGFDAENSTVSGFDTGAWATLTGGR